MSGDVTEEIRVGTHGVITSFTGRTRTVTLPGAALGAVLIGVDPAERDDMKGIMVETGVREGVEGTTPTPPHQDR